MLLVGHCSAVALFGLFIKIEQNGKIATILNSLKIYFLLHLHVTHYSSTNISNGADIRGNILPHMTFLNCRCHFIISE